MSLTSLLRGRKEQQKEFQKILRTHIPSKNKFYTLSRSQPFSKKDYQLSIPYILKDNYSPSVVGTAFDYLARIMIGRLIRRSKDRKEVYTELVAEQGLYILNKYLKNDQRTIKIINDKFHESINKIKVYVNSYKPIEDLIPIAYYLAKLEQIARSGMLPEDIHESLLTNPSNEIYKDLNNLCRIFQSDFINKGLVHSNSVVDFNPNFGYASILVGGADADIIIDGILYDFKTTKHVGYRWNEVSQLLGYFYLHHLSKKMRKFGIPYSGVELPIKTVAFYRARYSEIEAFDVNIDEKDVDEVISELIKYFNKYPTRGMILSPTLHEVMIEMSAL